MWFHARTQHYCDSLNVSVVNGTPTSSPHIKYWPDNQPSRQKVLVGLLNSGHTSECTSKPSHDSLTHILANTMPYCSNSSQNKGVYSIFIHGHQQGRHLLPSPLNPGLLGKIYIGGKYKILIIKTETIFYKSVF